ncbi:MAG: PhzF family phenazine biosynthesis protein [Woeseia sp.]
MNKRFHLIDVFASQPFTGNPLPVVHDADDLSAQQMQSITRWMNHSETAFLVSPRVTLADYRVRIFTLEREMPFAGHPTLGACHAWLAAGGERKNDQMAIQECGAGLVPIQVLGGKLAFAAPPLIRSGAVDESTLAEIIRVLKLQPDQVKASAWADNGPGWVVILLDTAQAVLDVEPVRQHHSRLDIGVVGAYPEGSNVAFELRAFFSDDHGSIREDPVTGSLNASSAQWLFETGRATTDYIASQGTKIGRAGRIQISRDAEGAVWVGGHTTTVVAGNLSLEENGTVVFAE